MRNPFKRKKKEIQVPKGWVEDKKTKHQSTSSFVTVKPKKPRKFRLPGLRTAKRGLAGVLLVFNALMALSTLAIPQGQLLFLFFFLNSFFLLDYLYKTKRVKLEWSEEK